MKTLFLVVASVVSVSAGVAHAQTGVAQELSIARCVVDNDALRVRALLHGVAGDPAQARVTKSLVELYGACDDNKTVKGTLSWRERATIAHEAVAVQLESGKANFVPVNLGTSWSAMPDSAALAAGKYDKMAVGMLQFGTCVVKAMPDASFALMRSKPDSAEETAAVDSIAPSLQSCIPTGQKFTMKRADLRLVVAEPVYEILTAGDAGTQR